MPSIVHSLLVLELQIVCTWIIFAYYFTALKHAIWKSFVVTTTNHKYTWLTESYLNHLEIMWEVSFEINELVNATFVLDIEDWNGPRVFLENVKFWWEFCREALSQISSFCIIRSKSSNKLLLLRHFSVSTRVHHLEAISLSLLWGRLSFPSFFLDENTSFAIFHMLKKLAVTNFLLTPWANYLYHVHKIFDFDIYIYGPIILVARWTSDNSVLAACLAIKHLAINVRTLLRIPNKILAHFAQKMMIYSIQRRRSKIILRDHELLGHHL